MKPLAENFNPLSSVYRIQMGVQEKNSACSEVLFVGEFSRNTFAIPTILTQGAFRTIITMHLLGTKGFSR